MNRLPSLGLPAFLIISLMAYAVVPGWGLLHEGRHPDDWLHAGGYVDLWLSSEGRWAQDLIYHAFLSEGFVKPLQIGLAYLCFVATAWLLAGRVSTGRFQGWAALAIFLAGVNHVYLAEALSWDAQLFSFSLALLLSVSGFLLLHHADERGGALYRVVIGVVAAQMIAVSFAFYQPYALFGAIVPLLVLLRWDQVGFLQVLRLLIYTALAGILAIVLTNLEWTLVAALSGIPVIPARLDVTNLATLSGKIAHLDIYLRNLYSGAILSIPRIARLAFLLFAAVAATLPVLAALLFAVTPGTPFRRRIEALFRSASALALIFAVAPILFFYLLASDYIPARAVGFIGFWIAALTAAGITQLASVGKDRAPVRAVLLAGCVALVTAAATQTALSGLIWRDRAKLADVEVALADRIMEAVTAIDSNPDHIRIVGGMPEGWNTFRWGGFFADHQFDRHQTHKGLFEIRYSPSVKAEGTPVSPRDCPAFPAEGSVFLSEDIIYVCLEAANAFVPPTNCAAMSEPAFGAVCVMDDWLVVRLPDCGTAGADPDVLKYRWNDPRTGRQLGGQDITRNVTRRVIDEFPAQALDGGCYHFLFGYALNATEIELTVDTLDGRQLFKDRVELTAAE